VLRKWLDHSANASDRDEKLDKTGRAIGRGGEQGERSPPRSTATGCIVKGKHREEEGGMRQDGRVCSRRESKEKSVGRRLFYITIRRTQCVALFVSLTYGGGLRIR
jgi:hypothetical protein